MVNSSPSDVLPGHFDVRGILSRMGAAELQQIMASFNLPYEPTMEQAYLVELLEDHILLLSSADEDNLDCEATEVDWNKVEGSQDIASPCCSTVAESVNKKGPWIVNVGKKKFSTADKHQSRVVLRMHNSMGPGFKDDFTNVQHRMLQFSKSSVMRSHAARSAHVRPVMWFVQWVFESKLWDSKVPITSQRLVDAGVRAYYDLVVRHKSSSWSACLTRFVNALVVFFKFEYIHFQQQDATGGADKDAAGQAWRQLQADNVRYIYLHMHPYASQTHPDVFSAFGKISTECI